MKQQWGYRNRHDTRWEDVNGKPYTRELATEICRTHNWTLLVRDVSDPRVVSIR